METDRFVLCYLRVMAALLALLGEDRAAGESRQIRQTSDQHISLRRFKMLPFPQDIPGNGNPM